MTRHNLPLGDLIRAAKAAIAHAPVTGEWSPALELVARSVGGWGCHLNRMAPGLGLLASQTGAVSKDIVQEFAAYQGTSPSINLRAAAIFDAPLMSVRSEEDFVIADDWRKSRYYNEFLLKIDAPYSAFAKLAETPKDATAVTVLRSKSQGHASHNDKAVLHHLLLKLKSAIELQQMLDRRGLNIAAGCLERAGVIAVICDPYLNLLTMSDEAEAALKNGDFISAAKGKLKLATAAQQRKLQRAAMFASLLYSDHQACSRFKIADRENHNEKILAVAPVTESETALFQRGILVLLLDTDLQNKSPPRTLIKLTHAEIDIAKMLIRGRTTREIANFRSVSKSTVQTQIKAMGAKFETSHRAGLLIALQEWFGE